MRKLFYYVIINFLTSILCNTCHLPFVHIGLTPGCYLAMPEMDSLITLDAFPVPKMDLEYLEVGGVLLTA